MRGHEGDETSLRIRHPPSPDEPGSDGNGLGRPLIPEGRPPRFTALARGRVPGRERSPAAPRMPSHPFPPPFWMLGWSRSERG
jgi:hypothetical protein